MVRALMTQFTTKLRQIPFETDLKIYIQMMSTTKHFLKTRISSEEVDEVKPWVMTQGIRASIFLFSNGCHPFYPQFDVLIFILKRGFHI